MPRRASLLVVAGESSGDVMASRILEHLEVEASGVGGPALASHGARLIAELPAVAAMGVTDVVVRLPRLLWLGARLLRLADQIGARAALLVGYSELNGWLGPRLRERGTRVLWYGAPQVWAWRSRRKRRLGRACDRMVVWLPFEQALWRDTGVDAVYLGHPALEGTRLGRADARARLGFVGAGPGALLLPGSRPREVDRLLPVLLAAARRLQAAGIRCSVGCAPGLGPRRARAVAEHARAAGVHARHIPPEAFSAFDVAIACSGTATLECALAGVPPVIAYRTDPLSAAIARRLLTVDDIGLPNLLLGRRVFPELVQHELTAERAARAAERVLMAREELLAACVRVGDLLRDGAVPQPSRGAAEMIESWLS